MKKLCLFISLCAFTGVALANQEIANLLKKEIFELKKAGQLQQEMITKRVADEIVAGNLNQEEAEEILEVAVQQ